LTIAQPAGTHLAHFNWAILADDPGTDRVAGFENAVDKVHIVAERAPGFVWRHLADEREAAIEIGWPLFTETPRLIASFSVWETPDAFRHYVYQTVHGAFLRRSEEWFEARPKPNHVLWFLPAGQIPTIADARDKVDQYLAQGPGRDVFDVPMLMETATSE
jgi:heme-degrading monooxygenase HmoA